MSTPPPQTSDPAPEPAAGRGWFRIRHDLGRLDRLRSRPAVAGAAVLVALLTWPFVPSRGGAGLDLSWQAALAMVWEQRIDWGPSLYFTYGPLGFLSSVSYDPSLVMSGPVPWYGATYTASVLFILAQWVGLAVLLIAASRPALGTVGSIAAAYAVLAFAPLAAPETGAMIVVAGAILAIRIRPDDEVRPVVLAALGAAGSLMLLIKATAGVIALAAALAATVALARRRRDALAPLLSTLVGFVVLWMLSGQSPGAIPGWFTGTLEVARGFPDAMWLPGDSRDLGTTLLLAALGVWLASRVSAGLPRRQRAALLFVVVFTLWMMFKASFIRHDAQHALIIFAVIAILSLLLCWRPDVRGHALVLAGAGIVLFSMVSGTDWLDRADPRERVSALRNQVGTALRPEHQRAAVSETTANTRAAYALPTSLLGGLSGTDRTVNVDPWELGVVWSEALRLRPMPALQRYSMYTARIDGDAARVLASERGPDTVLRHEGGGIDGRYVPFDGPETYLELLCNYREVATADGWQRLDRIPDRCGPGDHLAAVVLDEGETVAVPTAGPDDIVVARFSGSHGNAIRSLWELITRVKSGPSIVVDGAPHRLIAATAEQPHVLVPSERTEWSPPFTQAPVETLAFTGFGDVTVTFTRIPVRGP